LGTIQRAPIALSVIGASHVKAGIPCQDSSDAGSLGEWHYAIVADGHSSERYFRSDRGAKFAVNVLRSAFHKAALSKNVEPVDLITEWKTWSDSWVLENWLRQVREDLLADPPSIGGSTEVEFGLKRLLERIMTLQGYAGIVTFGNQINGFEEFARSRRGDSKDASSIVDTQSMDVRNDANEKWQIRAYGSTLLGLMVKSDCILWFQLGDGALIEVHDDDATYLVPPPESAIGNETPSLCMVTARDFVNVGGVTLSQLNDSDTFLVSSDGLPNSYDFPEGFLAFCTDLCKVAQAGSDIDKTLESWLPRISQKGSGDDMSIAAIFPIMSDDVDMLKPAIVGTSVALGDEVKSIQEIETSDTFDYPNPEDMDAQNR